MAVPGAIGQIAAATGLGTLAGMAFGWELRSAVVLGLAISAGSTVVLVRALQHRGLVDTDAGRVAIGRLIVADLFTVVALVLLPVLASATDGGHGVTPVDVVLEAGGAISKAVVLTAVMVLLGSRFLPWLLSRVEGEGSRELFTLAVLAIAVGIAFASAVIFDVSLALGAFLAGAVISGSRVGDRAAADVLPLTDVFTVLFFVSVGMLLDPGIFVHHPIQILVVAAIVIVGKSVVAVLLVRVLRRPSSVGRVVGAGLAQIGESSFIVAEAGRTLGLFTDEAFQVIVAVSLISITLNPGLFALALRRGRSRQTV